MYAEASDKVKIDYIEMNSNPKTTADFGANRPVGEVFIDYKGQKIFNVRQRSTRTKYDSRSTSGHLRTWVQIPLAPPIIDNLIILFIISIILFYVVFV